MALTDDYDLPYDPLNPIWFEDGSVILKFRELNVRVHGSLLGSQSPFWKHWLEERVKDAKVKIPVPALKPGQRADDERLIERVDVRPAIGGGVRNGIQHNNKDRRQSYGLDFNWACEWRLLGSIKKANLWSALPSLYYRMICKYEATYFLDGLRAHGDRLLELDARERIVLIVAQQQLVELQRKHTWGWLFDSYTCTESDDCKRLKDELRGVIGRAKCDRWNECIRALSEWDSDWD
ncbi:hypothetical protein H0H93_016945 [Arthromyces matolae]|nr:hypothetical protein H0H93_016945 [Arthromyces matolae]